MSIQIAVEHKIYHAKVSGSLEIMICYPDNLLFLYFSNGVYQIWDILQDKFVIDGMIDKDLKHIRFFNKYEIAYYSFQKQELRIFNIFEKKEKKITAKVPTKQAIPENERSDQALKTLYDEGTSFLALHLSGFLVVLEQRNNIMNSNDNIITVFDETSSPFFYQTVYANAIQKNLNLSSVNNKDTILVWGDTFNDQPLEFFILNVLKKDAGFKVVTLHTLTLNCQLMNVMGWGVDEILLLGNYNSGSLLIKIINYVDEKEIKNIEIEENSLIKDGLMIETMFNNFFDKFVMFVVLMQKNAFVCYCDVEKGKIRVRKPLENDVTGMAQKFFSEFNNFYVELEGENINNMDKIQFRLSLVVKKKDWTLFLLDKKKIIQKYGKWVAQEILSFLE